MRSPSFKFYPDNFIGATQLFTDAQVGKYMRLLCLQYQYGRLSKEDMLSVCKKYDKRIFDKFLIDENGLYYNKRLEHELTKSNKYSESRSKNRAKNNTYDKDMKNICKTYDEDMKNIPVCIYEYETDNEYVNVDTNRGKIKATDEWRGFVEMRKRIKAPLTDRAATMLLSNLEKLAPNDIEKQRLILDQSTYKCWKGVFELKDDYTPKESEPTKRFIQTGVDDADMPIGYWEETV